MAILALAVLGLIAGLGLTVVTLLGSGTAPAATPTVAPAGSGAQATVDAVIRVLGQRSIQAAVAQRPFRPAETTTLSRVPRTVVQAVLPDDLDHGFIVVYDLATEERATDAGREFAAYLASGPGRVQFPTDARFTLRRVGSTLVFFTWSPANWPDERSAAIQAALETLGTAIPVGS